ncbi:AraC family transcriptional regulator [Lactovum miscens]|uniref:AraC-like DNA-binding protein/mannose-6-phosphate isomerase-like protein (Cupin superfamily) n=1 Tax=Lactovum miscens TaxID=190387 RepID=A0A841C7S1_9LACT|nr:helix-turn-helix domain-containing protein [Lactovum miscens]MBB5887642.1 AraC-like DNA-binding protein/mannose-6-phosphate isomerase-like protein (cupin superfamily) [Lactovum miscens]
MLNNVVKDYLYNYNTIELIQKETQEVIFDYPNNAFITGKNKDLSFVKTFFLKNRAVYISKHNRFADYPTHTHDFLEFNYMLDGKCEQIINGEPFTLHTGDLLLMDNNSHHKIRALSEHDILINIIFPMENFSTELLSELKQQKNMLFQFLMQDISKHSEGGFVFFDAEKNPTIRDILEQMINVYFTGLTFSNEILRSYVPILFMELIGNTDYHLNGVVQKTITNETIIQSLKYIESEYQTLTLSELSKKLAYNKNYLSNLLKAKLGHTFTELLNEERLKNSVLLLELTTLPITDVAEQVGFSNLNYFYRIFTKKYGVKPKEFRMKKG